MSSFKSITPSEVSTRELHGYLLGAVGPRPIALASTLDLDGNPNLAPFSFFNVFSANPPILIFSPARRVRNNTTKHTLQNAEETYEVVVNIVNYDMVQQMSLSSTEYPDGINEFIKSGLNMLPSEEIKPFRVAESPVQFECKVIRIEALGGEGGAGNLIICEVVKIHVSEDILSKEGSIDPKKIDQVARMGGNWYSRAVSGLFEVPKPLSSLGIGVDSIPETIRDSHILTGNDLGKLGNIEKLPEEQEIEDFVADNHELRALLSAEDTEKLHARAQDYLIENDVLSAWKVLLAKL